MEKGMLSLSNCRCDAAAFMTHTRKGLDHFREKEFWQADNAFYTALLLWQGEFMPGVELCDPADLFRSEIQNRYLDSAVAWCTILMDNGRLSEATKIAEQALQSDDINHVLVRILYRLHSLRDDPVRAAKTINNYKKSLNNAGFGIEEIEGVVESLFAPS
jgi:two-component SAPR family response regulator